MAARVVARARLAFNWEATQYDRPSYGYYIWYRNITNNSVQATFPCAEIKAQLQQFDASIQLADNDDPDHDIVNCCCNVVPVQCTLAESLYRLKFREWEIHICIMMMLK